MAASTIYDIKLRYVVQDEVSNAMKRMTANTGKLDHRLQASINSAKRLGSHLRMIGIGAAAFFGAKALRAGYDFVNTIEQAKISMAGIMQMNLGGAWSMNMQKASKLIGFFREDAVKSTATMQDFTQFAKGIASPLVQAGASLEDIRAITRGGVIAGQAFGIEAHTASRDIRQALMGKLTVRDELPRLLGLDTTAWNEMARDNPKKAMLELRKVLSSGPVKAMAEAQANTFLGKWSTVKDKLQQVMGGVMKPVMDHMVKNLQHLSAWIDQNPQKIAQFVSDMSSGLIKAFNIVKDALSFLYRNKELFMVMAKAFLAFKAARLGVGIFGAAAQGLGLLDASAKATAGGLTGLTGKITGAATAFSRVAPLAAAIGIGLQAALDYGLEKQENRVDKAANLAFVRERIANLTNTNITGYKRNLRFLGGEVGIESQGQTGRRRRAEEDLAAMGGQTMQQRMQEEAARAIRTKLGIRGFQANAEKDATYAQIGSMIPAAVGVGQHAIMLRQIMDAMDYEKSLRIKAATEMYNAGQDAALILNKTGIDMSSMFMETMLGGWFATSKKPGEGDKPKSTGKVNVTIQRIEVKSEDPDRFVFGLSEAFQNVARNRGAAFDQLPEG